jgi:hypothetical protein
VKSLGSVSSNGWTKGVGRTGFDGTEGATVNVVVGVELESEPLLTKEREVVGVGDVVVESAELIPPRERTGSSA